MEATEIAEKIGETHEDPFDGMDHPRFRSRSMIRMWGY